MDKIFVAMKIVIIFLPALFILTSCNRNSYSRDYTYGNDGLIYKTETKELYSGKITDTTSNFILVTEVKNGKRNGEFIIYNLSGNKYIHGYMKNNMNDGKWEYFYPDGIIESEGVFISDKPEGRWTFYYPNGLKSEEGNFSQGVRVGQWTFYDSTGRVDSSITFTGNNN